MIATQLETLINSQLITADNDTLLSINDVTWEQYETLLNELGDSAAFRI